MLNIFIFNIYKYLVYEKMKLFNLLFLVLILVILQKSIVKEVLYISGHLHLDINNECGITGCR